MRSPPAESDPVHRAVPRRRAPWHATGRVGRSSPKRKAPHQRASHVQATAIQRRTRSSRLADPLARHRIPADGIEVPVAPGTPRTETGSRLAVALLAYVAAITAVVTLLPFQFAIPSQPRVMLTGGLVDVLA